MLEAFSPLRFNIEDF